MLALTVYAHMLMHINYIFLSILIVGQIQLLIEYGSQYGQLQVHILEVNSLYLPAGSAYGDLVIK